MSTEPTTPVDPAHRHRQVVLVLTVTVIAFAAIVVLALTGHVEAAKLISGVWLVT